MFDLVANQEIEKLRKALVQYMTLLEAVCCVLVVRGLATKEELEQIQAIATSKIDQLAAEQRDQKLAAMSPVEKAIFEATGLDLSRSE